MIRNFTAHSANERTYLAWIRTAIAIMAFGFLVEKFDIFLFYIAMALHRTAKAHPGTLSARSLGMALVVLGIGMMLVATVRFIRLGREIDRADERDKDSRWPDMAMIGALMALGVLLLAYLAHLTGGP
ncbi:MAG: DUF202 domain-containing protein [Gammaproteobacteria bacterium]|nr:DUF202 domain-containing protein [Gammaproteobacteria bacterium]